jgi:hypothetical protein
VYVIGNPGSPTAKIGISDNPYRRVSAIQAMSPVPVEVLWSCPGSWGLERALHAHFAEYHSHGEWYTFPGDPVQAVQEAVQAGIQPPAPRPAKPSAKRTAKDPNELRMTPARALYVAIRNHFGDSQFCAADVAEVFGLAEGIVRQRLVYLLRQGLLDAGAPTPGLHVNRPRKQFVVRPLRDGQFIGAPSYGASVPKPRGDQPT